MKRRWLVPEVIQSSAMDCGPASLKALLEGFGIRASYGRLREACQTDVDGTSIDTLETTAVELGLDAQQVMAPRDHFLLPESNLLPALTVVRLPDGGTHFVVVWRKTGPWLQVMDPAEGRQFVTAGKLLDELYLHTQPAPAADWREWFGGGGVLRMLRRRMGDVGIGEADQERLIGRALADGSWKTLGALDAAVRMLASLEKAGGAPGGAAGRLAETLMDDPAAIPARHWSVAADPNDAGGVLFTGVVLIHAQGVLPEEKRAGAPAAALRAALEEKEEHPALALARILAPGNRASMALVAAALAAAGAGAAAEALLFRGLFATARHLQLSMQRMGAAAAVMLFLLALLAIEWPLLAGVFRLGRVLDLRLRIRFLAKLPLLSDRYFQSRLSSDMAHRAHAAQALRTAPELSGQLLRALATMAATLGGIAWLYPESFFWALGAAVVTTAIPLLAQPALTERDLRVRTHAGSLSRFFTDALLGLTAIRAHAAERALRHEQDRQLLEWARAVQRLQRSVVTVEGITLTAAYGSVAALVFQRMNAADDPASLLLLLYWALSLPQLGQEIAAVAWQVPGLRNIAVRLIEPLNTPVEERAPAGAAPAPGAGTGVAVTLNEVTAQAGGHVILNGISLRLEAGSHTAIVGASGAGKSSLVGLLLGWHKPSSGEVLVDGEPLAGERLERLRRETVWVDPQVQLWNRSLLENLRYGAEDARGDLEGTIAAAHLEPVLRKLEHGLKTPLGEAGALVSGGEGQRVRFGRGLSRPAARLVILDEPARGLDRAQRRRMIERARERWPKATLLCITHDIGDSGLFERVLVVDRAGVVEDGCPRELAAKEGSRYRALLEAEAAVREGLWQGSMWRRVRVRDGRLEEAR